ncbi:hypothetical protein CXF43_08650 [Corynebacterium bovis]|nr:hypothetical protein CXF32_01795 [Corynebacterium bovis]RRQ00708.1 hypothetical protein CXF31_00290 [Corynebacterium bovis]RRQ06487.1 hypothetical protein CXF43_08650 [Corynebacterium bovis]RRQ09526.1 hypothetical protein CXF44_07780 [Corynebacterium bovis]
MAAMTYTVEVTREDGDWLATVTGFEGVSTWATTFAGLDRAVREAIALAEDLPEGREDQLDIAWDLPAGSDDVAAALVVAQQRRSLVQRQRQIDPQIHSVVATLSAAGWSVRDQAALLGMTAGRVSQILNQAA